MIPLVIIGHPETARNWEARRAAEAGLNVEVRKLAAAIRLALAEIRRGSGAGAKADVRR